MSNIGFAGVANYSSTSSATATHVSAVSAIGGADETVQGPSLALNFLAEVSGSDALDPRITFSRASNATRVGPTGLIEYAPHNLLTYSEQFDNAAWSKGVGGVAVAPVVTANAGLAPDGTLTADQVVFSLNGGTSSADFSWLTQNTTTSAGITHTQSVWMRTLSGTAEIINDFDSANDNKATVTTEWQRFTFSKVMAVGGTRQSRIGLRGGSGSSVSATILIWGAQLNVGALQPYYPTTVKNLLGYTQEFDNAAWTKSNSFVQTNLLTYSQEFDNAAWSKSGILSVTSNATASPDGFVNADLVIPTATTVQHFVSQTVTGAAHNFSTYVKAGGYSSVILFFTVHNSYVTFDLSTQTVTETSGTITSSSITDVGNGWYRVSVATSLTTHTEARVYVTVGGTYATRTVAGDGTSGVYIWGAQLVQGDTAGDYTRTFGSAKAVGYVAPDGSVTAEKLVEDTANSYRYVNQSVSVSTSTYTASFYAKAGERSWALIAFGNNPTSGGVWFNLSTGVVGTRQANAISSSITSVGNGWYRCSAVVAMTSGTATFRISTASADNVATYTGDGTSGIYVWGAQLSDSASVDPYVYNPVAAPSASAYYGPRFDYDPVTLAPKGLLIEEQRTNLQTFSEQFDNAVWTKTRSSIASDAATSPDGTLDADKLVEDTTASSTHDLTVSHSFTSGTTYTFSFYAKRSGRNVRLYFSSAVFGTAYSTVFNLENGTASAAVTGSVFAITPAGNGWYRCSMTHVATATVNSGFTLRLIEGDSTIIYTGDGTSGIYIWGAQLEAGSFPTSYIPTTSASVTRSADVATMVGANFSNWYNQNEGTLFADFTPVGAFNNARAVVSLNDGSSANFIYIGSRNGSANYGTNSRIGSGAIVSTGAFGATNTQNQKAVFSYNSTDQYATFNAETVATSTASLPIVTQLMLGGITSVTIATYISRIAYFPRRLANTELQAITA